MLERKPCWLLLMIVNISCVSLPPQYENSPSDIALDPEAAIVQIKEFVSSPIKEKYDEVAMLKCSLAGNFVSAQANIISCENKFKNEAIKMGSILVLVKPEHRRVGQEIINVGSGRPMHCANCVDMRGIVLKAKKTN